jgi:hypothetical protein
MSRDLNNGISYSHDDKGPKQSSVVGKLDMAIDLFLSNIVSVLLLDGLVLGLGGAFIVTSFCGAYFTRTKPSGSKWGVGGMLIVVVGVFSGFVFYGLLELATFWAGPAIHGLSGSDIGLWNSLVSTAFSYQLNLATAFAYLGSMAGITMGYALGISPKEESTTFGVVWTVLAIFILLAGLALILLQMIIMANSEVLYFMDGISTVALVLFALYKNRKAVPSTSSDYEV